MAVNPVPEGYRTATPYLTVRGAADAIEFYKKAFGAQEVYRMPGPGGKLMHAEFRIGDSMIMLSDEFPEMGATCRSPQSLGGTSVGVHLYVPDCDAVCRQALAVGAQSVRPPSDMFWGDRMGQIVDPFGHTWTIATHKEDLTPAQMEERQRAFVAGMGKHA